MKKKITYVNDCASVSQTIAKYIDKEDFEVKLLFRTRGIWSKTIGLSWKILRSESDVYHVAYALQDAYLVSKLKHLDVLHCHGSDVRWSIRGKYGWIVKSSLRDAKVVLFSTPDQQEDIAPYRGDAIYLPNPIELSVFYPLPELRRGDRLRAIYFVKPYERIPEELVEELKRNKVRLDLVEGRPYGFEEMPGLLNSYHVFVDRFEVPSLSKTCLEAMACGLCTINYTHLENLRKVVEDLTGEEYRKNEGVKNRKFIEEHHDAVKVSERMMKIYRDL